MRNQKTYTILGLIFGIILFIIIVIIFNSKDETIWYASLNQDKPNHAYGIKLCKDLIKKNIAKENSFYTINRPIKTIFNKQTKGDYFFIGNGNIYFSEDDQKSFLDFIKRGNKAFIASSHFQKDLLTGILEGHYTVTNVKPKDYNNFDDEEEYDSVEVYREVIRTQNINYLNVKFDNSGFTKFVKVDNYKPDSFTSIAYFNDSITYFSNYKIEVLARDKLNDPIYVKINIGKGAIYWWANPWTLGNVNLIQNQGLKVFSKIFQDFKSDTVYWEQFHLVPNYENESSRNNFKSALRFILSEKSLRWAWYLLLVSGILYLIFNIKRKQKQIPIFRLPENTTEEYLKTISNLYQSESNSDILILRMKLEHLFTFIRLKYKLLLKENKEDFIDKLHQISEVEKATIAMILVHYDMLNKQSYVDENQVQEVVEDINKFYHQINRK